MNPPGSSAWRRTVLPACVLLLLASHTWAQNTYTVTSTADDGSAGTLRWAIQQANAAGGSATHTIDLSGLSGTVSLSAALPIVTASVAITGSGADNLTISGGNQYRVFFVDTATPSAAVSIQNLTISNGYAKGGSGGASAGGGMGAGGALFVNRGAVTVSNVNFSGNAAQGGAGGNGVSSIYTTAGGGGGLGGNGGNGNYLAGGGGGGYQGNGGNVGSSANSGGGGGGIYGNGGDGGSGAGGGGGGTTAAVGSTGGAGGGNGNRPGSPDGASGSTGGGGAGAIGSPTLNGVGGNGGNYGGGGGSTGTYTYPPVVTGSGGDFGGGGGRGNGWGAGTAGSGGFGGGGGAGTSVYQSGPYFTDGGAGGFGGGGGGGANAGGTSAAYGGSGGYYTLVHGNGPGGGGGAALGGAVFVRGGNGASLTFAGGAVTGSTVTGGAAGTTIPTPQVYISTGTNQGFYADTFQSATDGSAGGSDLFLAGGTTAVQSGSFSGSIGLYSATLQKTGAGTFILAGGIQGTADSQLTLSGGTFQVGAGSAAGDLNVSVLNDAALRFNTSANVTLSGALSGTGVLTQSGTGTVTLTGDATHTGGTTVAAGTLRIGAGGTTGSLGGNVTDNAALLFNRSDTSTFSGAISGTGTLTKSGAGTLALTGDNTFTGGTTITAGTIQVGAGGTTGSLAGAIDVGVGATLAFNRSDALLVSGPISGAGTVTQAGAGTVTLSGANTYTGGTTLSGGLLALGSAGALGGSGTIRFIGGGLQFSASNTTDYSARFSSAANQSFTFDTNGQNVTLATALSSSGGLLNKRGAGTLTLTSSPGYDGPTTVAAGTLQLAGGAQLTNATALSVASGATFDLNGIAMPVGSLAGAGTVALGVATLTTGGDNTATTFSGTITGSGALAKTGTGTLTLTGTNLYTGGTTLSGGALSLGSSGALGASGTIRFNGGALQFSAGNTTDYSARFSTGSGQSYRFDTNGQSVTLAGSLASLGGSLTKDGAGTLTLSGANTFTGTTTVNAGSLALANASALAGSTFAGGAGTLSFGSLTTATLGGLAGSSALALANDTSQAVALAVGGNNANTAYSGALSGSGSLVKTGTGTLTLSGTNTYTGGTTLTAGTLALGSGGALGSTGTISFNGGTLQFTVGATTDYSARFSSAPNQAYALDTNGQSVTLASALTSAGGTLTKLGTGTLTLSGTNTYSGGTTVNGGTLAVTSDANLGDTSGSVALHNATLDFGASTATTARNFGISGYSYLNSDGNLTINGGLSGAGNLFKTGAGTVALTGASTHTGGLYVNAGTIALGASNVLANTEGVTTNGGTFSIGAFSDTVGAVSLLAGSITGTGTLTASSYSVRSGTVSANLAGSASLVKSTGGTVTLSGTNTYTGGTSISAGTINFSSLANFGTGNINLTANDGVSSFQWASGNTADLSSRLNPVNVNGREIHFDTNGNNVTFASPLRQTANAGFVYFVKDGAGTLTLAAGGNYDAGAILAGGTVSIADASALGNPGDGLATLQFNGGTLRTTANLSLPSTLPFQINQNGSAVEVASGTKLTITGPIQFYSALTKTGAGTLELTADSNNGFGNSGGLLVSAGTLRANNGSGSAIGDGPLTIASGATLGGAGYIGGATTLQSGSHLAPGNSPGTLTFTNGLTLQSGVTLDFELGTVSDLIAVTGGTLTGPSSGTVTLNFSDAGGFAAGTYTLFDFSTGGTTTNSFDVSDFALGSTIAGFNYQFSQIGSTLQLTATASAVPEPSTYAALAGLAALGFVAWRRRGRRSIGAYSCDPTTVTGGLRSPAPPPARAVGQP